MSIANYTELQAAVASWLKRDDLTANIPDFISLAEARHARDLRLVQMLTTTTLATVAGVRTVALPADWLHPRSLALVSPYRRLAPASPGKFAEEFPSTFNASPKFYAFAGSNLLLGPTPDSVYSIEATYYARPPALSGSNPTNWLLTEHPGLYLWATLAEAEPFLLNDQRGPLWEAKYMADLTQATNADAKTLGSGMRIRAR